jgi:hypothetical protein
MDTKERKTAVHGTPSGAQFSPPDPQSWRPAPPASGKNRVRKTRIDFKSISKKFFWLGFEPELAGTQKFASLLLE